MSLLLNAKQQREIWGQRWMSRFFVLWNLLVKSLPLASLLGIWALILVSAQL